MTSLRSFLACERRSASCLGLSEMPSSTAEMANTVPPQNAALRSTASVSLPFGAHELGKSTHCCTPGAAQVNPAEFFCNLINLTILAAAAKHFSVDTLVVGSPERRRKKGRCSWMCIML